MIVQFVYDNPTWLWGTLFVGGFSGLACLGLLIFHRVVQLDMRKAHNELAGFTVAIISVTYAVLLAFVAIATWESFAKADDTIQSEADYVGSIYRDTQGLPAAMGQDIRTEMRSYVTTVVDQEWPEQREGITPVQGWDALRRIHSDIVTMHPADLGEAVIQSELLRTLNELYSARASRLSAAQGHVPEIVWWIIIIGATLTTGFTYLFGFHDFRMHLAMTAAVATSLALVIVLIIAMDWPFRGDVSVSPEAFVNTQQSWTNLSFPR